MAAGEIPCKKVYEDEEIIAFRDINPQAPVHILVIPRKHIPGLNGTNDSILLGNLLSVSSKIAKQEKVDESGYRLVINTNKDGGQTVNHLHVHLLGGRVMTWPPG